MANYSLSMQQRRRHGSARLLALLALISPARTGEITASLTSSHVRVSGTGEGLFFFGDWPMAPSEELRNLKAVSAISGCTALDDTNLQGKTAIVFGASGCDGLSLYYMLQQQHATRLVVVSDSPDADVGQRNWGLNSDSVPSWVHGLGNIYGLSNAWAAPMRGQNLDGAVLRITPKVTPLALGTEVSGAVVRGHMNLYSFEAPLSSDLSYTITVTPTSGNPNLYVNTGSSAAAVRLPDFRAESVHTDPGDDALDLQLIRGHQAFVVGVYGESASDYTLVLSQADTVVPLLSGESKRFSVPAGRFRYFKATVPHGALGNGLNIAVTPFSGDPDLFVSLASTRPDSVSPECTASSGHPSWCSGNAPGRYEHVEIGPDDTSRCSLAECPYYIGVLAKNVASTFSVVAAWGDTPIRLVDGVPQAGQLSTAGESRAYMTRVAGSHTDLSITLTNTYGNAHIYVRSGHPASATDKTWTSNTLATGDERLLISHTDTAHFCVDCDYYVAVVADGPTSFTITATSSHGVTVLENGAPCNEVVNAGEYEYFKLFVTAQLVEVQVIMTAFSGNPDMFLSLTEPYPNATSATWRSTDVEGDVITISNVAFDYRPKSEELDACLNPPEGAVATQACVLYIAVHGFEGASSFSLAADARALSSGFHIDAPAGSAGDYEFTVSTFGAPMPTRPLSASVVKAEPLTACGDGLTSDGQLVNAADVAGSIAWVERGPHDERCPYPGRYFANKVMVAQRAGAVAVIMSNNDEDGGLIYMGSVSGDHAAAVSIPSIFVSYDVGHNIIQRGLTEGVRVSLSQPLGRLPLLVNGVPQAGAAAANQMKYYEVFMSPGNDELTINVNPRFGNPDVYVTSSRKGYSLPTRDDFVWSSTAEGSETLTIPHGDEYACSGVAGCRYWIGVLGGDVGDGSASTTFTIMTSIDEAMMTLQSNVPLPAQEVELLAYKYYRFYVDRAGQGITVALTLDSGDADLYVSFDAERPTEGHAQFVANGQTGCQTVDCGNSIANGDAVHISAAEVQANCRLPCLAYIGVRGALASTYNLLVTTADAAQERPIRLSDGIEQQIQLQNAGDYAYFSFHVPDTVRSFEVNVVPSSGDPDLYVGANATYPTRDNYDWRSTGGAGEVLTISTDHAWACVECDYHFSVYAWSANVAFSITVTTERGTRLLRDGVPAATMVHVGQIRYFRYLVRSTAQLQAVVTPFSGDPSLFVRFGIKPFNPNNKTDVALVGKPTYSSTEASGIEAVIVGPDSDHFCHPPCTMYVAVRNDGAVNASCSVVVQQRASGVTRLVDGMPQAGVVAAHEARRYSLSVPSGANVSITFASLMGSPKLYLSADEQAPTASRHADYADASKPRMTIAGRQGAATFQLAVDGQGHPANFSLVARTSHGVQLLQDGTQQTETLQPSERAFYKVIVPAGAEQPFLLVSPYQGSVTLELSPQLARIDEWPTRSRPNPDVPIAHRHSATADAPAALPLTAGATNMLCVTSEAQLGRSSQAITISLLPVLTEGQETALPDGQPQFRAALANEPVRFRYFAPASNTYAISAVELDQPPDARLRMYVGQSRYPETPQPGANVVVAEAEVGEVANRYILGSAEYGCTANCLLFVSVVPTHDANLSVTASAEGFVTALPVGEGHKVAGLVARQAYAQYALKLDRRDEADDNVNVHLQVCSGAAQMYAAPTPSPTVANAAHAADAAEPLPLRSEDLKGAGEYFVSVYGEEPTTFNLKVLPRAKTPAMRSLTGDAGVLKFSPQGKTQLQLDFDMLAVPCMFDAQMRGASVDGSCGADPYAADEVVLDPSRVAYEVYVARREANTVMGTWCGVHQSHGWRLASSFDPISSYQISWDTRHSRVSLKLRLPDSVYEMPSNCSDPASAERCATTLVRGEPYLLTVVALHDDEGPLDRREQLENADGTYHIYRAVYTPVVWTAGGGGGGGGMSGGGVFFLLVFIALCVAGAYWGYLVYTGRRDGKKDIADLAEKAQIVAAAAADKIRSVDWAGLWAKIVAAVGAAVDFARGLAGGGRRGGSSGDGPFVPLGAPRARTQPGSDTMSSPLAASSYTQDTSGALPPLAATLPPATPEATTTTTAATSGTTEPLQLSVHVNAQDTQPLPPLTCNGSVAPAQPSQQSSMD